MRPRVVATATGANARYEIVQLGPPTRSFVTFLGEPDLVESDIESRRSPHDHLQVVLVHLRPFEQLVDEHPTLDLGGCTPDCVDVEIGKVRGDRFEPLGYHGRPLVLLFANQRSRGSKL